MIITYPTDPIITSCVFERMISFIINYIKGLYDHKIYLGTLPEKRLYITKNLDVNASLEAFPKQ